MRYGNGKYNLNMVQATELRIGNWVLKDGKLIKTTARDIYRVSNGLTTRQPITLTDQVLLDCGFELKKVNNWRGSKKWSYKDAATLIDITDRYYPPYADHDGNVCVYVQYLHQLQNVFNCLERIELEYQKIT